MWGKDASFAYFQAPCVPGHVRETDDEIAAQKKRPAPRANVHELVQELIKHLETAKPHAGSSPDAVARDMMLDVELDGVRCLLMRVPPPHSRRAFVLSARESEIARMVACGYPNKTIAGVLEISSWTVSTYLRRIFAKLNVNSRAAMVARLMEEGLLKGCQDSTGRTTGSQNKR